MSLNGLDDPKVKEAHDAAVAEPGGWFLLKYQSRDEVDILGRGNGGIVEIRNAIAQYEEPSPLFGFLRYRRRNVLIKFVPEGCSRLVQARVHVHFNAVTERFSPHDTIFPIENSKELKDSTLSAACSLHTASGSTSSSTSSLRRRRLMEIEEENEEETRAAKKRQSTVHEELFERPTSIKEPSIAPSQSSLPSPSVASTPPKVSLERRNLETSPPPPSAPFTFVAKSDLETSPPPPRTSISESRSRSPTRSIDNRKNSSQSMRPDLYSYNSFGSNGKPKVKLGPRPSLDTAGRPNTSSSTGEFRPVSSLPPGLKLYSRGASKSSDRSQSVLPTTSEAEPPSMTLSPPPIPESPTDADGLTARPHTSGGRPTTSSGASIKSARSAHVPAATSKKDTMTPEKARLMKALQMRKKQLASPPPSQPLPPLPRKGSDASSSDPKSPESPPREVHDTLAMLKNMAEEEPEDAVHDENENESDATHTLSTPNSPMEPSEKAESTKASSVSESTDETVQDTRDEIKFDQVERAEPYTDDHPGDATSPQTRESGVAVNQVESDFSHSIVPQTSEQHAAKSLDHSPTLPDIPAHSFIVLEPVDIAEIHASAEAGNADPDATDLCTSKKEESPELTEDTPDQAASAAPGMSDLHEIKESLIIAAPAPAPFGETAVSRMNLPSPDTLDSTPRQMMIPRSKFSVQDLKSENDAPQNLNVPTAQPGKSQLGQVTSPDPPLSPMGSTFSNDSIENGYGPRGSMKRKGLVEPIRTDISVTDRSGFNTENDFSDDDDLMEELQSATFQEAKPIQVSKSPMAGGFPKLSPNATGGHENRFSRAFSQPLTRPDSSGQSLRPDSRGGESIRSVSAGAAYLQRINEQKNQPVLAKKVNIGSSISQRIKALEQNLTPESAAAVPAQNSSPAFFAVRKVSVRTNSRATSVADRANSFTRDTPSPSGSRDDSPSPETLKFRRRSGSIASRLTKFDSAEDNLNQRGQPESISVTARIVRDPAQPFPSKPSAGQDPSDYQPLDLKQSPLVIDHQKAVVASLPSKDAFNDNRLSSSTSASTIKNERRSSISLVKDMLESSRNSFSSRRSLTLDVASTAAGARSSSSSRPPSTHTNTNSPLLARPVSNQSSRRSISSREGSSSNLPAQTNDDANPEKKGSRTSRMMRRMSSGITASRKTLTHALSPTVREEDDANSNLPAPSISTRRSQASLVSTSSAQTVAEVGDVNVQFPDTLLWKRRSVRLDSAGYLILSPSQGTGSMSMSSVAKVGTRKIHLSEFREPFIPDAEAMEMPNSVVLQYIRSEDGGVGGDLQIACEDRGGQLRVLEALQEAHSSCHGN